MSSHEGRKKHKVHASTARSDINVTPLIDIVLVLLIIFIVMVPGLSKAAKVVVPQVVKTDVPPPPNPKDPPLVITIDENKLMAQVGEPRPYLPQFDADDGSVVDW